MSKFIPRKALLKQKSIQDLMRINNLKHLASAQEKIEKSPSGELKDILNKDELKQITKAMSNLDV